MNVRDDDTRSREREGGGVTRDGGGDARDGRQDIRLAGPRRRGETSGPVVI